MDPAVRNQLIVAIALSMVFVLLKRDKKKGKRTKSEPEDTFV
jgi:hypothetical protein